MNSEPKKKRKKGQTVLPGEKDENGKLLTPHTKYGIFSNFKFVIKGMWESKKSLFPIMVITLITQPMMQYIWGFFTKYILDIAENAQKSGNSSFEPLVRAIIWIIVIDIALRFANSFTNAKGDVGFIITRFGMIEKRIGKALCMSYETLEQPHILDMASRASRATGGNNNGVEGLMRNLRDIGRNTVTVIVSFSFITALDYRLIISLVFIGLINFASFKWAVYKDKKNVWDAMAPYWRQQDYMDRCTQDFDFAKDIRLFSMKKWLSQKQHSTLAVWLDKYRIGRNGWLIHSVIYTITGLASGAFMYFVLINSVMSPENPMSIGNFTLYISLCGAFSNALSGFLNMLGEIDRNSMQTDDFRTFIDYKDFQEALYRLEIVDGGVRMKHAKGSDDAPDAVVSSAMEMFLRGEYNFEFKNVSYKYAGSDKYALKNLNLEFKSGERLAVVGLNGAGKTTFIKLLLRLYNVSEGQILLNGIDVQKFDREDYFALFAPVFQNVEIFAFPLCENVSMKPSNDTDKKRAYDMLCQSGMKDKTDSLPKGVDTELLKIIEDDGVDLSGGEKQKLALARALYKNSPVIVLDEPTAALDALAEYELYKNFDEMIGNKSALYISHRLSSTRFCNHVAMFANGEMVEYGTHDSLIELGGEYAKMFEVQAQYYEENGTSKENGEVTANE